ncbi:MAG TPA: hypothetical protein PLS49_04630 [Candidatus Woesebacteria bacterium]|nr:hypothetical protein [Candidatus Woesebacteria bacterium]
MKLVKVVLIPAILAVIVYLIYITIVNSNKPHSPLPDEGIKVIQITPSS